MTTTFLDSIRSRDILDPARLGLIIQRGVDLNVMLLNYLYPLELAAWSLNIEACRMLLEAGAKTNAAPIGIRPIHVLAYATKDSDGVDLARMRSVCELLIAYGADLNGPHTSQSPLHAAVRANNHAAVKLLIALGADVNHLAMAQEGQNKTSVLERAFWARDEAMMLVLLRAGADDGGLAKGALTPFQQSVFTGLGSVIEYYVSERGEDLSQKTAGGKSLIQLAPQERTKQLLRSLKAGIAIANEIKLPTEDGDRVLPRAPSRSDRSPL